MTRRGLLGGRGSPWKALIQPQEPSEERAINAYWQVAALKLFEHTVTQYIQLLQLRLDSETLNTEQVTVYRLLFTP